MEHGQQTGESIGAMLSSIASTLREVGDKLDAVAARMDGVRLEGGEQTLEGRLAKLEAWAFRAEQDISGIDTRVERLESGTTAPSGDAANAAERPAAALPRAAAGRRNAALPERRTGETATVSESNESQERPSGSRNGAPRPDALREPLRAAREPNATPKPGFSPPREPTLETNATTAQNYAVPAPRDPAPNFTAPAPREPTAFTVPAAHESTLDFPPPREPAAAQQETFTAPRDPGGTSRPYPPTTSGPYESLLASADSSEHVVGQGRPESGAAPDAHATGLTGAHRASEQDQTPVDNSHVDKLQAMLDELKRNAAAPLARSDVFGPPAGDPSSAGHQAEHADAAPRRLNDYRLSSPPPVS